MMGKHTTGSRLARLLVCGIAMLAALAGTVVPACAADREVVLTISTYPTSLDRNEALSTTVRVLTEALRPARLRVVSESLEGTIERISKGQTHLVILNAGQYRQMLNLGLRDIVSLKIPGFPDINHCDGGAIVVAANRGDIQGIPDLKGRVLSANTPIGFNGFAVQMGEIARAGFNPEKFFSRIVFRGEGDHMVETLDDVAAGRADAAFVRLCLLEI